MLLSLWEGRCPENYVCLLTNKHAHPTRAPQKQTLEDELEGEGGGGKVQRTRVGEMLTELTIMKARAWIVL